MQKIKFFLLGLFILVGFFSNYFVADAQIGSGTGTVFCAGGVPPVMNLSWSPPSLYGSPPSLTYDLLLINGPSRNRIYTGAANNYTHTTSDAFPLVQGSTPQYQVEVIDFAGSPTIVDSYFINGPFASCNSTINVTTSGAPSSGTWTITAPTGESGSASSNVFRPAHAGTTYTINVTAPSGYNVSLISNSKGGSASGSSPTLSLAMQMFPIETASFSISYQAFAPPPRNLTVVKNGTGAGNITSSPSGINCVNGGGDCTEQYTDGTNVTLTASVTSGSFGGWSGGGCSGTNLTCVVNMNADKTVTATFDSVNVNIQGSNNGSTYTGGPVYLGVGQNFWYQWTSSGAPTCHILSPINSGVTLNGTTGPLSISHPHYPSPSGTTYTLQCPLGGSSSSFFAQRVPSAPNVTATSGNCGVLPISITLNWSASTGATSYNILRSTNSGGPYTQIASGVTGTSYVNNSGLTGSTQYHYVVQAVNAAGASSNSSQASTWAPPSSCPVNQPPVAYAGTDQSITQPATTSAPVGATATDPDGNLQSFAWSFQGGPASATITNSTTLTPSFSGLSALGVYTFRLTATDTNLLTHSDDMQVTVGTANTPPTVTNPTVSNITATDVLLGANVTSLGSPASITARGTCWGTSPSPGTNCVAASGTTTGVFTHTRNGLSPNNTYYFRGYADHVTGRNHSADGTFNTNRDLTADAATPSTATVGTSQVFNATVRNIGSINTGAGFSNFFQVCNSAHSSQTCPTTPTNLASSVMSALNGGASANAVSPGYNFPAAGTYAVRVCADFTAPATGGAITEVDENNNCGLWTNVTVSVGNVAPTVTTPTFANVSSTDALLGANVTSLGSPASITARGTCWGTTPAPTTNCSPHGTTTTGVFTHTRNGLSQNTTYYFRGYANNGLTGYSPDGTFNTNRDITADPSSPNVALVGTPLTFNAVIRSVGSIGTGGGFSNFFQICNSAHSSQTCPTTPTTVAANPSATTALTTASPTRTITSSSVTFGAAQCASNVCAVRICTDGTAPATGGVVSEINETNNCGAWTNVTVSATGDPDLTAIDPTPTTTTHGSTTVFSSTIFNNGPVTTGASSFPNLFQIDNDTDHVTSVFANLTSSAGPVSAGGNAPISISTIIPTPGTWYIRACADHNGAIGVINEGANEGNNCSNWVTVTVNASASPDLTVLSANDPTPTSANTGSSTLFSSTMTNIGSASTGAGAFSNVFQFDDSSDASRNTIVATQITSAGPVAGNNGTAALSASYTFPSTGTWYVRACADSDGVDPDGVIGEVNEANNCSNWVTVNVSAGAPSQPDLTILPANDPTPTSANTGSNTTFNSIVSNIGNASTGSSYTNIFQFDNDSNHGTVIATQTLTAGPTTQSNTSPISSAYTFPTAGTWYVRSCADNNASFVGTITESSEGNNCSNWVPVTVSAPASPVIVSFTAAPSSTTNPGDPSTLTWVSNNTNHCTSDFFAGNGPTSGSQAVNPLVTTTYNLTCVNTTLSQQVSAQVTVTVGSGAQKKPIFYED